MIGVAFLLFLSPIQGSAPTAGPQGDATLVATGQLVRPFGKTLEVPGRPVDAALSAKGDRLFVKDMGQVRVIDTGKWEQVQELASPGGASIWGIAVSKSGKQVFSTSSETHLHIYREEADGKYAKTATIALPGPGGKGNSFPCGVALTEDEKRAFVALSRNNTLGIVDLASRRLVRQIRTGVAPYGVLPLNARVVAVSNQGGRFPKPGERTAPSAGTETLINENGTAKSGTVSLIDVQTGKEVASIEVGLQPTQMLRKGNVLLVANANSDTVSVIDLPSRKRLRDIVVKPDLKLPFGSMPNAISASADGRSAFVALAGNNALAVLDLTEPRSPRVAGFVPTGWYPTGVLAKNGQVYVVNNKGVGSRTRNRPEAQGWNSHDHRGSLQVFDTLSATELGSQTAQVRELGQYRSILAAYEKSVKPGVAALPMPATLGEPSSIKHVMYVIKENRTYDQILGDIAKGDGDPQLCTFGRDLSPNHHDLAEKFVLLDNYFCNGVLSADGHSWATEGNVTPYLDRAFGGFNRSYTFGDDPITYSSSGFLWDQFLGAGLSFRNYGEMNYAEPPKGVDYFKILEAVKSGQEVKYSHNIGVARLRRYSMTDYPGWNMNIPDIARIDKFLKEFREFERNGQLPNLTILYLPQDHFGGPVTSAAHMADNDLAIGMLVEAVSKSVYWKDTVLFINEDDPQNGYDHVDGRRSICLVVSPYTQHGRVISEFYNQTSVLRSILHIFGLPPMNQRDASSKVMSACFDKEANMAPYTAIIPKTPVDERPKVQSLRDILWMAACATIPMGRTGQKSEANDELFNRAIWHEMKGYDTPYPIAFAGEHGKGFAMRRLKADPTFKKRDDDDG